MVRKLEVELILSLIYAVISGDSLRGVRMKCSYTFCGKLFFRLGVGKLI